METESNLMDVDQDEQQVSAFKEESARLEEKSEDKEMDFNKLMKLEQEFEDKKKELEELVKMKKRLLSLISLGTMILNFAITYLELDTCEELSETKLRAAYSEFFTNPSEDQKDLSAVMINKISKIAQINCICEVVDRFEHVYMYRCKIINNPRLTEEQSGVNEKSDLISLLESAPPPKDYDTQLLQVLHSF